MHEHIHVVRDFMLGVGQHTPLCPTTPSEEERILRARLILEEALELINKGLGIDVKMGFHPKLVKISELDLDIARPFDMIETVDGAEDLRWVGVDGVYAICGVSPEEPMKEIDASNLSKLEDGYRREDGKWMKGPNYIPVSLSDKIKPIGFTE